MKSYISAAVIFAALLVTVPAAPLAVSELRHTSAAEPTAAVYKSENSEKETKKQTEAQESSENSKKENEKENKNSKHKCVEYWDCTDINSSICCNSALWEK